MSTRRVGLIAIAAMAILDAQTVWAALLPPIPDPNLVAIYNDLTSFSFDPTTHAYFGTGPVSAVQLPGEIVTAIDPLVAAGAIMTQSGLFTGTGINPYSNFDPTGHLVNYTIEITVGADLVLSETFPDMALLAIYTSGNSVTADFVGLPSSRFVDNASLNSPALQYFAEAAFSYGSDTYNWITGTFTHNNSDIVPSPEPAGVVLLPIGAVLIALTYRRKRATIAS